jgi:hypothetical protein
VSEIDAHLSDARCPNCGTPLVGQYCHACGQRRINPASLTVRHFVQDIADEIAHLDSKTLRSLRALFRPGYLTREYLAGRRLAYTAPLRLYLVCAAIFFFISPLAGFNLNAWIEQDRTGHLARIVDERLKTQGMDRALFAERFDLRLQTVYTAGLTVSVASAALLLKLLYRRQHRPFGAHVVFALHYVSFLYLLAVVVGIVNARLQNPLASFAFAYAITGPYMFLALRRVHGGTALRTLVNCAVLLVVSFVIDGAVNVAALIVTLRLV